MPVGRVISLRGRIIFSGKCAESRNQHTVNLTYDGYISGYRYIVLSVKLSRQTMS